MIESKDKLVRRFRLENGESVDLDIIRISMKLTKINDHITKGEGISISWAEVGDPKLLDDALDAFMDFIIKSKDRRIALMNAVGRAERRAELKLKASSDMVN